MNNTKKNVCIFLITVFAIAIIASFCMYNSTEASYESAKAHDRYEDSRDSKEKLQDIESERNLCMIVGWGSGIGLILCSIILYSSENYKNTLIAEGKIPSESSTKINNNNDNNTQSKLTELKSLYDSQLITEDEYNQKRKELLDKM